MIYNNGSAITVYNAIFDRVFDFEVSQQQYASFELDIRNHALNGLQVLGRFSITGSFKILHSVGTDFTTPTGFITAASGDVTAQVVGSDGWFTMNAGNLETIRILAKSSNALGSIVTIKASKK